MISKNHMEMCRFASRDDDGYEKFLVALKAYIEAIKTIKPERQHTEVEDERERREGRSK